MSSLERLRQESMSAVSTMASATGARVSTAGEREVTEAALEQVRNLLKDPDSAQFKDVRLVDYRDGKVVCGRVNAKNSYGGYVGYKQFVAGVNDAELWVSEPKYGDIERAANAGLNSACRT